MPPPLLLTLLVICLGGLTQGVTGFGFGLVVMPLLPLFMDLKDAVALTVLLNLVVCGLTLASLRGGWSVRQGLTLIVGACVGVPVGVYFLSHCSEPVLLKVLGAVMICFALNELFVVARTRTALSPRLGFPLGVVSGGLSGAFNMGGPPAVAFTYSQPWTKEQTVAVLQLVFGLTTVLRILLLGTSGVINKPILTLGLWALLPLVATIYLGGRLFSRVPHAAIKRATFVFLGVMGLKYLFF